MIDYKNFINALRKCAKEHENDGTFTGHIIVSDLCRDTANLLESLEQEPILDKIIAEIEEIGTYDGLYIDRAYVLQIIDKYKAESEDKG